MAKFMRRDKFERVLRNTKDVTDLTIAVVTIPQMSKKENPYYGRVQKHKIVNIRLNEDYQKAVNEQRRNEGVIGEFKTAHRAWGTHIQDTPLVEHKGEIYLHCIILNDGPSTLLLDGVPAQPEDVAAINTYLPTSKGSKRQEVVDKIEVRDIKLSSITGLSVDGVVIPLV